MKHHQINYLNEIQEFFGRADLRGFFAHPVSQFALKVVTIVFFVWIFLSIILMQASYALKNVKLFKNKTVQVYLKGAVQNPTALWKSSELYEEREKFSEAIVDMELAIGLLEMHHAPEEMKRAYKERLVNLKKMK